MHEVVGRVWAGAHVGVVVVVVQSSGVVLDTDSWMVQGSVYCVRRRDLHSRQPHAAGLMESERAE